MFILGAYPSAVHVEWIPPAPFKRIAAIPIDDEPTPFWNGEDQAVRVEAWKARVGFRPSWGIVKNVPRLNGPSGAWVQRRLLGPLGCTSSDAWVTDCLDIYHASVGVMLRLTDTYDPFAATVSLPRAHLPSHPDESRIVRGALEHHRDRLRFELEAARPDLVVTLGNAALRVLGAIVEVRDAAPARLRVENYGTELTIRAAGRLVRWLPLAHPAAPTVYRQAHERWASSPARCR